VSRRRPLNQSSGYEGTIGIALIVLALAALVAFGYFQLTRQKKTDLDRATLCPISGPLGVSVVLVDTSDDLPKTTQQEVLQILDDQIIGLPAYHKLDIRILDIENNKSRSLFSKCNPGDGTGLSEWTDNPNIARERWIESFRKPAREALKGSMGASSAKSSPILGAMQDIAIDQFTPQNVRNVPKSLLVISDMLEHTRDYSQYPSAGDLSYDRYRKSAAYPRYRTDLYGTGVSFYYVQRLTPKIDSARHMQFWRDWAVDNRGTFVRALKLQGAG
jgi:hypothetical protein